MLLTVSENAATDKTMSLLEDLVAQFANVEFDGPLMLVVLMLAAGYICLEGYGIYRMALAAIGFAVGFKRAHLVIDYFSLQLTDEQMIMAQAVAGLICAVLAWGLVQAGIYIAAYHFAQANLASALTAIVLEHVDIPELLIPVATRIIGLAIAAGIAYLAMKSERMVVVVLTAVIGGFAAVDYFVQLIHVFPVDISDLDNAPDVVWLGAKLFLSAAGVGIQGTKQAK